MRIGKIFNRYFIPILYHRFFVIKNKNLIKNLVDFYNRNFNYKEYKLSPKEAFQFCRFALRCNADLWKSINPQTEEDIKLFYRITPFYIFESVYVWMDLSHRLFLREITPYIKGKVLDYGGGIGVVSIYFAKKGYEVSYTEVSGITRKFAEFLFKKENLDIKIIELESISNYIGKFDTIICRDVVEHLYNPKKTLEILAQLLNKKGYLIITNLNCKGPSEDNPMHFKINFDYEGLLNSENIFKVKEWLWVKK